MRSVLLDYDTETLLLRQHVPEGKMPTSITPSGRGEGTAETHKPAREEGSRTQGTLRPSRKNRSASSSCSALSAWDLPKPKPEIEEQPDELSSWDEPRDKGRGRMKKRPT